MQQDFICDVLIWRMLSVSGKLHSQLSLFLIQAPAVLPQILTFDHKSSPPPLSIAVEAKIMLAFKRFQSRLRPQRLKCRKKYEQRQQKSVVQSSYACSKGHHQSVVKVVSKMRVHTFRANKWQIKVLLVVFQKQLISKKTKILDWA